MSKASEILVDLSEMVVAIEHAVDLVGMNDTNHGKRVGYIAMQIADFLGFSPEEKLFVFELGLLHDCGVSSDSVHNYLVKEFDWEESSKHCEIGYNLLKDFQPLSALAVPIRYHHAHWNKLKTMDISDKDKRLANLTYLSDRVDASSARYYGREILLHKAEIDKVISDKKDKYFDPELVEAFLSVSGPEAFWISLEDRHINRFAWETSNQRHAEKLNLQDLKQLARIFSYIVDQKSPFTAQHSYGVARLARALAGKLDFQADELDIIEVAGYLHDIGKLHVPDSILEKPGPLSTFERSVMNQHSYETYEILKPIKGLEEIAKYAAYHHENCIGTGYPFHLSTSEIPLPAKIIAVSDVFQALVQDRPYRKGMNVDQVVKIIKEMADDSKLDRDVVDMAVRDSEQCFMIARGEE